MIMNKNPIHDLIMPLSIYSINDTYKGNTPSVQVCACDRSDNPLAMLLFSYQYAFDLILDIDN